MIRIDKRVWYYRLVEKEGKLSLFDRYSEGDMEDYFLVSLEKAQGDDTIRMFSVFEDYVDFMVYQKGIPHKERCFHEMILGHVTQKPRFDIDMEVGNKGKFPHDIDLVIESLVNSISITMGNLSLLFDPSRHVVLCTSHGKDKKSAHLVIDGYYHNNNNEAREFYKMVISKVNRKYHKYIDPAVYSSRQQFRMLGNRKPGSTRVKTLRSIWKYKDTMVRYTLGDTSDYRRTDMEYFRRSLVTETDGCLVIPISSRVKPKIFEEGEEINNTEFLSAKKLIETVITGFSDKFEYRGVKGRLLLLKTLESYYCKSCDREHEKENPYIVVGHKGRVIFRCRRSDNGLVLGRIKVDSEEQEKQVDRAVGGEKTNNTKYTESQSIDSDASYESEEEPLEIDLEELEVLPEYQARHREKSNRNIDMIIEDPLCM